MAEKLEFDPVAHRYTLDGRSVPSVTQILGILNERSLSRIPAHVLEAARTRGEFVHRAINLFNRAELDESSLSDDLVPYVDTWKRFLAESGAVVIASEQSVYHKSLRFAGTPDLVLDWNGRTVVPDIKATAVVPATVGPQTAAYAESLWLMHGGRGRRPLRRCIHLLPFGREYRVHERSDPSDWQMFVSCLNVYRFLEKAG